MIVIKKQKLHTVTQVNDLPISCNNGTHTMYTTLSVRFWVAKGNPV